jgi:hypothetical protein
MDSDSSYILAKSDISRLVCERSLRLWTTQRRTQHMASCPCAPSSRHAEAVCGRSLQWILCRHLRQPAHDSEIQPAHDPAFLVIQTSSPKLSRHFHQLLPALPTTIHQRLQVVFMSFFMQSLSFAISIRNRPSPTISGPECGFKFIPKLRAGYLAHFQLHKSPTYCCRGFVVLKRSGLVHLLSCKKI